jgi:hypothetical protein
MMERLNRKRPFKAIDDDSINELGFLIGANKSLYEQNGTMTNSNNNNTNSNTNSNNSDEDFEYENENTNTNTNTNTKLLKISPNEKFSLHKRSTSTSSLPSDPYQLSKYNLEKAQSDNYLNVYNFGSINILSNGNSNCSTCIATNNGSKWSTSEGVIVNSKYTFIRHVSGVTHNPWIKKYKDLLVNTLYEYSTTGIAQYFSSTTN